MKIRHAIFAAMVLLAVSTRAATTVDSTNHYAYGANIGWVDGRGDTNNGAVIGEYVCSGYIYAANVGWINLGNGAPTNGIYYQNLSTNDFGVNQDGAGNLRGLAYGANIGWVNFETNGAPKVNLGTGSFSGYAYGANVGWISLSNAVAYVQTDTIVKAALSTNGLPIPWLLQNFGTTNVPANADPDHDGQSNAQEYLAGTDPNNGSDYLRITFYRRNFITANYNEVQWNAKPTRFYAVQLNSTLLTNLAWVDVGTYPFPGVGSTGFSDPVDQRFYRIRAYRPMIP